MQRFYVKTFGCRASQADGAALEAALSAKGLSQTVERGAADLVVLNTCTVTATADDEVRQTVRRIHRENPDARILVTGCYAQRAPRGDRRAARRVAGGRQFAQDADRRSGLEPPASVSRQIEVGDIFAQHDFLCSPVEDALGDRTRPNLKIQDGCNNRCSFCIIPFVRGRSRSAPGGQVIEQVRGWPAKYQRGRAERHQSGPLGPGSRAAACGWWTCCGGCWMRPPIERLRLSSVEPMDFSDELLALMAEIAAHREARACAAAIRLGPRAAADASQISAAALCGSDRQGSRVDAGLRRGRRCHDRISRARRKRSSRDRARSSRVCRSPICTCSRIRSGREHRRRRRRRRCRWRCASAGRMYCASLAARKNREFRSVDDRPDALGGDRLKRDGPALSGNYLKIALASPREPNRIVDVRIGGVTAEGLSEAGMLRVL